MSMPSALVKLMLRMSGLKHVFSSPAAMRWFLSHARPENDRKPPSRMSARFEVETYQVQERPVYHLKPKAAPAKKHVLFLHGGAYVNAMIWLHWSFLDRLSKAMPCEMTVPLYGLAPEHHFREGYAFALDVYRRLLKSTAPQDIVLMGDSSGGGMALGLAQLLRDEGLPQPGRIVMLSPWLDLTSNNPDFEAVAPRDPLLAQAGAREAATMWAGGADLDHPLLSPLNGDLHGLAPLCLLVGTDDSLMPDCRRLRDKALAQAQPLFYREYNRMFHVWMLVPLPEAKQAIDEIVRFIEEPEGLLDGEPQPSAEAS